MAKLNKYLVVILVLQIGVIAASKVFSSDSGPAKPKKVFDKLDADEIAGIEVIDSDNKRAELKKVSGAWVLASGGGYPVKQDKVKELLSKLPGLKAGPPVSTKKSHHHKLEVADDKFQRKVTLSLKDGRKHNFFLGSSPLVRRVHLRFAGKDEVLLAGELSAWDISTAAGGWVNTDYFKVDKESVKGLTLTNSHGTIQLDKSSGSWQLAAEAGTEADKPKPGAKKEEEERKLKQTEIDSLLGTATSIALQEPVGTKVETAHELDKPVATLSLIVEDKPKDKAAMPPSDAGAAAPVRRTISLAVGAQKGDDGYFAKGSTSKFVVLIGKWAADTLKDKKLDDLVEKEEDKDKDKDKNSPTPMGPVPSPMSPVP